MRLNLPDMEKLSRCQNVLIAGMGGGYDIFCGLPLYFELRQRGVNVHLANLTFTQTQYAKNVIQFDPALNQTLCGVTAQTKSVLQYFPELHLARWLAEQGGTPEATVWCFNAPGAQPLFAAYQSLVAHLHIDGIVLMDGGVDSLMRGDEAEMGTVLEDAFSLSAVSRLEGLTACVLACVGMGAEQELTHAHVLENIAALTEAGGFLGACSLVPQMECARFYQSAVEHAFAQKHQDPSVINASIVSALSGQFGNFHLTERTKGSRLWISPLMSLFWFFETSAVAERNLFLTRLHRSQSFADGVAAIAECRALVPIRAKSRVPL